METASTQNQVVEAGSAAAARVSVWKLTWECYKALVLGLVVGVLVAIPAIHFSVTTRFMSYAEVVYEVGNSPSAENRVVDWAKRSPGVENFRCERKGGDLWARWEYRGNEQPEAVRNAPQHLRELGYSFSGLRGISSGGVSQPMSGLVAEVLSDPVALGAALMGAQLSMGLIGWWRIRQGRRKGRTVAPLFSPHYGRAALVGLVTGMGLFGLGWVYTASLQRVLGSTPASPWNAVETMHTTARVALLIFAGLGAPVAEEIFFRGYVFGVFKGANKVGHGIVISAVLFALAHFSDAYNMPAVLLFGVVLAWSFHRTGSLLTSMLAHSLNNGLAIAVMVWR